MDMTFGGFWDTFTQYDGQLLIAMQKVMIHDALTPAAKFITHLGDHGIIWLALIILLLLSTACLVGDSYNPFIYFQF